jgi:DnaJ-class molecular chaperone
MYNGATKELKYERAVISFDGEVSENKTKETLKVEVKPGFGSHTTLVFPGAGDERYGAHPSDLIVNIEQVANDSFRRNGDNLIYTHKIQLVDALSPKPFHVTTLDSRTLALVPPQVVSP